MFTNTQLIRCVQAQVQLLLSYNYANTATNENTKTTIKLTAFKWILGLTQY